jgi:hypothetical protein
MEPVRSSKHFAVLVPDYKVRIISQKVKRFKFLDHLLFSVNTSAEMCSVLLTDAYEAKKYKRNNENYNLFLSYKKIIIKFTGNCSLWGDIKISKGSVLPDETTSTIIEPRCSLLLHEAKLFLYLIK